MGSRKLRRLIDDFASDTQVLSFDEAAALKYGTVAARLSKSGTPIGTMDTLLAAHALSVDLTFVTNNEKHFRRVRGLKTENWL